MIDSARTTSARCARHARLAWSARQTSIAALLCALVGTACGNGSGSDLTRYTLSLQSDAPCYGARAEIDLTALTEAEGSCTLRDDVAAAGCFADVYTQDELLVADARGCMIDAGSELFECRLAAETASQVQAATTVTYGCGCQDVCPTTVSLAVAAAGTSPNAAVEQDARKRPIVVHTTAVSTTSSTCGTCCDYYTTSGVVMDAATAVTEVAFVLSLEGHTTACPFDASECHLSVDTDGPGYLRKVGRTLEVCLSDSVGIDAHATLIGCEFLAPSFSTPPLTLVRADGERLEPLEPPPTLTLFENF